jgi:hypothetical protein
MDAKTHKLTDREIEVTRAMIAALAAFWCAPPEMVIKQLTGYLWTDAEAAALANVV